MQRRLLFEVNGVNLVAVAYEPGAGIFRALGAGEVEWRVTHGVGLVDVLFELVHQVGDHVVIVVEGRLVQYTHAVLVLQRGVGVQILQQEPEQFVRVFGRQMEGSPTVVRHRDLIGPRLDHQANLLIDLLHRERH
jgi:hypothetical protein